MKPPLPSSPQPLLPRHCTTPVGAGVVRLRRDARHRGVERRARSRHDARRRRGIDADLPVRVVAPAVGFAPAARDSDRARMVVADAHALESVVREHERWQRRAGQAVDNVAPADHAAGRGAAGGKLARADRREREVAAGRQRLCPVAAEKLGSSLAFILFLPLIFTIRLTVGQ